MWQCLSILKMPHNPAILGLGTYVNLPKNAKTFKKIFILHCLQKLKVSKQTTYP